MCVRECVYVYGMQAVPVESRRRHYVSWNWNYRWLQDT